MGALERASFRISCGSMRPVNRRRVRTEWGNRSMIDRSLEDSCLGVSQLRVIGSSGFTNRQHYRAITGWCGTQSMGALERRRRREFLKLSSMRNETVLSSARNMASFRAKTEGAAKETTKKSNAALGVAISVALGAAVVNSPIAAADPRRRDIEERETSTIVESVHPNTRLDLRDASDSSEARFGVRHASSSTTFPFYDFLLQQLRVVVYVEDRDRKTITSDSGRNKPSGLVGLACRHCMDAGIDDEDVTNRPPSAPPTPEPNASIFPQDRRSLARDVATKMYHHVSSCENCPRSTRQKLAELWGEHQRQKKGHYGNRKPPLVSRDERLYFRDLWYRMGHKDMADGQGNGRRGPTFNFQN